MSTGLKLILDEMAELLVRYTKISKDELYYPLEIESTLSLDQLSKLMDFIIDFKVKEFAEFKRIYRLPLQPNDAPFELWDYYFQTGKTNLVEMRMLLAQGRVCRTAWRQSPFKRKKTNGKAKESDQNSSVGAVEAIGIRPEDKRAAG